MLPDDFQVTAPPLPGRPVFEQEWRDLTFLHWSIEPELVAPFFPRGSRPDVLGGRTFVGLVPFRMQHAGLGSGHATPWLGDFPETNVRLYSIDDHGHHGVVFRSLESARLFTTLAARFGYRIPYTWAHMRIGRRGTRFKYVSRRRWPDAGPSTSVTVDVGAVLDQPSDLDIFLTARWGLHGTLAGRTVWHPNWHEPWTLHDAQLVGLDDELVAAAGVPVDGLPDVPVRWSGGVRTVFGRPQPI